ISTLPSPDTAHDLKSPEAKSFTAARETQVSKLTHAFPTFKGANLPYGSLFTFMPSPEVWEALLKQDPEHTVPRTRSKATLEAVSIPEMIQDWKFFKEERADSTPLKDIKPTSLIRTRDR
ncbi:hypothetical protein MC885_015222, partial [Smutsia gigantea]